MGNIPILKPREAEKLLLSLGFQLVRQRGSHRQYRHADGRATTIPFHESRDLAPQTLKQICEDIGVTVDAFLGRG